MWRRVILQRLIIGLLKQQLFREQFLEQFLLEQQLIVRCDLGQFIRCGRRLAAASSDEYADHGLLDGTDRLARDLQRRTR